MFSRSEGDVCLLQDICRLSYYEIRAPRREPLQREPLQREPLQTDNIQYSHIEFISPKTLAPSFLQRR